MTTRTIALTGNPNTGKSTIFNALTGSHQKIGNWPGVTVDKKVGNLTHRGQPVSIIDLPGTYSLHARSAEESVVMDYLKSEPPDLVVNILDATNLDRNLFLTLELLENGIPLLLNLNMMDEAKRRGITIDTVRLRTSLGMPVTVSVGSSRKSMAALMDICTTLSIKDVAAPSPRLLAHIERIRTLRAAQKSPDAIEEDIIAARYAFIDTIVAETVTRRQLDATTSEKIDGVLANGALAFPLLLALLYLMFYIAFSWIGQPLADAIGAWIEGTCKTAALAWMQAADVAPWMQSLIASGIIEGVGNVVKFVPLIFTLFFMLAFLDGTGYMARIAFILDPIMRRVGLTGKGIMPLIMGFGCSVPAILGARALDSEKDRLTSILVTPFLTCSAKLPTMALFAALFFPQQATNVIFAMYVLGIVVAILVAKLLGATAFREHGSTFLLELPPYRIPDFRSVCFETWDAGKGYLVKAGTVIFVMSCVIWFLSNFNANGMTGDMRDAFIASIGDAVRYLFLLHGFDTWEAGASIVTGILAKESIVSTLGILYGVGEVSVDAKDAVTTAAQFHATLGRAFTPAAALSFMVFAQLYTPCMTALGTIRKETNSLRWTAFAAAYTFGIAWLVSPVVYRGAHLFGIA